MPKRSILVLVERQRYNPISQILNSVDPALAGTPEGAEALPAWSEPTGF